MTTIYEFNTKNFKVKMTAEYDTDFDFSTSHMGQGLIDECIDNGIEPYTVECHVYFNDEVIGSDFLGGCLYVDIMDFRDNIGINTKSRKDGKNYGSYFSGMIKTAINESRIEFNKIKNQISEIKIKGALS